MEFAVPEPNTFPVSLVPCVNVEPELNVIPPASAAVNEWPVALAAQKVMEPLMLPFAPVET